MFYSTRRQAAARPARAWRDEESRARRGAASRAYWLSPNRFTMQLPAGGAPSVGPEASAKDRRRRNESRWHARRPRSGPGPTRRRGAAARAGKEGGARCADRAPQWRVLTPSGASLRSGLGGYVGTNAIYLRSYKASISALLILAHSVLVIAQTRTESGSNTGSWFTIATLGTP